MLSCLFTALSSIIPNRIQVKIFSEIVLHRITDIYKLCLTWFWSWSFIQNCIPIQKLCPFNRISLFFVNQSHCVVNCSRYDQWLWSMNFLFCNIFFSNTFCIVKSFDERYDWMTFLSQISLKIINFINDWKDFIQLFI